jgi:tetratricopeptide (TPR) repeat protein
MKNRPIPEKRSPAADRLQQGVRLHQQGQYDQAALHYAAILAVHPAHFDATHLLGVVRLQQGRASEASENIQAALKINPRSAEAWSNLGIAFANLGRAAEALASYDKALAIRPAYADALYNRAAALRELRRSEEAVASYDRAIAMRPDHVDALYNRGLALNDLGRLEPALASYDRAIALRPGFAEAHNNRGAALKELARLEEAVASYDRALALKPAYAEAHNNRGAALQELGRSQEALGSYQRALALQPAYAEAHCNSGNALRSLRQFEHALACYDRALALRPGYPEACFNRGVALQDLGRPAEALSSYDSALALRPDYFEALCNRGFALKELQRPAEAVASYDRALALRPEDPEARLNRGLNALMTGDFVAGWRDYEYRWSAKGAPARRLLAPWPTWRGEPLAGRRIVVYEEQGLGDVIQNARFLVGLAEEAAQVTFLVRASMRRLLHGLEPAVRLVDRAPEGEAFDFQCALMSVPGARATTLANLPADIPYLYAEEDRIARWALRSGGGGIRIGICWQGNPDAISEAGRSFPLIRLAPLAGIAGVRLICLQRTHGLEQLDALPAAMAVETLGAELDGGGDAFVDTAAVMASLDLIVTADTSIAHLAGALGRPVWVALKQAPDWRWMLDRADSPWYPTMRLYRQRARGDWSGVFEAMAADLGGLGKAAPV